MNDTVKSENGVVDENLWNWKRNDVLSFPKTNLNCPPQNYTFFSYNLPPVMLNSSIHNFPVNTFEMVGNCSQIDVLKMKNNVPLKSEPNDDSNDNVEIRTRLNSSNTKYNPSLFLEIELNTSEPSQLQPPANLVTDSDFTPIQLTSEPKKVLFDTDKSTSEKLFKCKICDKEWTDENYLEAHMSTHGQRNKVRSCDYCELTFPSKGKWYAHFKTHFNDPSYACAFCNSSFVTERYLQQHLKFHSSKQPLLGDSISGNLDQTEERSYPCTFCGKTFPDRSGILFHLRIHTSDVVYTCVYCGKMFLNKSELNLHVRIHTGEKTHVCELCNKTFLTTSNLKQHFRTHTGDKPYCCTNCDKAFSNKSNLMQHVKVHTGEKPYKCKYCEKSFTTTSNLTQHLRIHTGVKPYVCAVCGKAFINRSNLTQHKKVHTIKRRKDNTMEETDIPAENSNSFEKTSNSESDVQSSEEILSVSVPG